MAWAARIADPVASGFATASHGAKRIIPGSLLGQTAGLHSGLAAACRSILTRPPGARGRQERQREGDAGDRSEARPRAVALASRPTAAGPTRKPR